MATMVRMALLAASLLLPVHSSRATSMDDWPVKFHPHLDLGSTYNDNITISHDDKLGDFSFTVSPGLQLAYGNADHNYLSLDYTAGIERFYRDTEFDAVNHYVTFHSLFSFSRLKLQIDHAFKDEASENFQAATRIREDQNLTSISAEYSLNQYFSVGALYHQEFHHFPTPGQIDFELFEPGVALYYHLLPKTDLFGEVDYGWVLVAKGDDEQFQKVNVGVRGQITSKIKGQLEVGYENDDFAGSTPNIETVVAKVTLHADFTRHTFADLVVTRQVNPSITNSASSVTTTRADFTINQKIYREKFLVYIGGAYEHDAYSGVSRTDDIWEGRTGVRYFATKWLDFGASYRYQHDGSTVSTVSFDQNLVSVDALLHF